jgi:hypothetical protein
MGSSVQPLGRQGIVSLQDLVWAGLRLNALKSKPGLHLTIDVKLGSEGLARPSLKAGFELAVLDTINLELDFLG